MPVKLTSMFVHGSLASDLYSFINMRSAMTTAELKCRALRRTLGMGRRPQARDEVVETLPCTAVRRPPGCEVAYVVDRVVWMWKANRNEAR